MGDLGGVEVEGLHDLEGGVGVVGGVAELVGGEFLGGPVAGGDGFGFGEAQLEQVGHGSADADLVFVAAFFEDLVEVEDVVEGDAKAMADLAVIVLQSKADFEDAVGLDEAGDDGQAFRAVKLEDETAVGEGELDDVGAGAFLAGAEGGLGLGIESGHTGGEDRLSGGFALGFGVGNVDAVGSETEEGGQEGCLGFGELGRAVVGPGFLGGGWSLRRFAEESSDAVEPGRPGGALAGGR